MSWGGELGREGTHRLVQPPCFRASLTHWVTHAETGVGAEVGAGAGAERNESPLGTPSVWRSRAAAAEIAERRRNECPLSLRESCMFYKGSIDDSETRSEGERKQCERRALR